MNTITVNDLALHYRDEGDPKGAPVVFANSLGTNLHLWDPLLPHLPDGLRIIRYDKRGHGQSDCPPAPYSMGSLVGDAEALLDHLNVKDCVFVGLSIGGLIAQGLAAKRLDLVRAMVLSNTAAKIGTRDLWQERIDAIRAHGMKSIGGPVMKRWFGKRMPADVDHWRDMLTNTPEEGYVGCSYAIAGTDFITPTSGLRLPCLGIAASEDGATPPDLVRETTDLVPGSKFHLIRQAGHLPCIQKPEEYAKVLTSFLQDIGHI